MADPKYSPPLWLNGCARSVTAWWYLAAGIETDALRHPRLVSCTHPAYAELVTVAAALGWPERFRTDLTIHDRARLAIMPPGEPFAWCLRATGSHVIPQSFGRGNSASTDAAGFAAALAETFRGEVCRWYVWLGGSLLPATLESAIVLLRGADCAVQP